MTITLAFNELITITLGRKFNSGDPSCTNLHMLNLKVFNLASKFKCCKNRIFVEPQNYNPLIHCFSPASYNLNAVEAPSYLLNKPRNWCVPYRKNLLLKSKEIVVMKAALNWVAEDITGPYNFEKKKVFRNFCSKLFSDGKIKLRMVCPLTKSWGALFFNGH